MECIGYSIQIYLNLYSHFLLPRNNTTESLEWLLDSNNKYLDYASIVTYLNESDVLQSLTSDQSSMPFYQKIQIILDDYKRRRSLEFKFDMNVVNTIKEMGFSEKEVKEALRITNNNQISAVSVFNLFEVRFF